MFARQNLGRWVEDVWETPDPDAVQDELAVLNFYSETSADAIWHHLILWDPEEILRVREKQKMALARYGKQSLLQWDDVETQEIRRWYSHLADLLEEESAVTRGTED